MLAPAAIVLPAGTVTIERHHSRRPPQIFFAELPAARTRRHGLPADGVPVFSNIFAEDTIANSNYNGLQMSLERSYSHGLLFQASYTFSKAIDQGASFENELNPINFNATRGDSLLEREASLRLQSGLEFADSQVRRVQGQGAGRLGRVRDHHVSESVSRFACRLRMTRELMSSVFFEDANTPQVTGAIQFANPKGTINNIAVLA